MWAVAVGVAMVAAVGAGRGREVGTVFSVAVGRYMNGFGLTDISVSQHVRAKPKEIVEVNLQAS